MFKVNNKGTRATLMASFRCLYCELWTYFTSCSSVSIVNFEDVIADWERGLKNCTNSYIRQCVYCNYRKWLIKSLEFNSALSLGGKKFWSAQVCLSAPLKLGAVLIKTNIGISVTFFLRFTCLTLVFFFNFNKRQGPIKRSVLTSAHPRTFVFKWVGH